jgi:hypothetical protein
VTKLLISGTELMETPSKKVTVTREEEQVEPPNREKVKGAVHTLNNSKVPHYDRASSKI